MGAVDHSVASSFGARREMMMTPLMTARSPSGLRTPKVPLPPGESSKHGDAHERTDHLATGSVLLVLVSHVALPGNQAFRDLFGRGLFLATDCPADPSDAQLLGRRNVRARFP